MGSMSTTIFDLTGEGINLTDYVPDQVSSRDENAPKSPVMQSRTIKEKLAIGCFAHTWEKSKGNQLVVIDVAKAHTG